MFTQDFAPAERLTETKPDVFSRTHFIAWLETQDPATGYDYVTATTCLLTKYVQSFDKTCETTCVIGQRELYANPWPGMVRIPNQELEGVANSYPQTFGAALTRARALSLRVGGK